jgi:hypothetical protein
MRATSRISPVKCTVYKFRTFAWVAIATKTIATQTIATKELGLQESVQFNASAVPGSTADTDFF